MSSYFDKASAMFAEAMRSKPEAEAEKIVATVVDTYGSYIAHISKRLAKESRPAFEALKEKWIRIIARPLIDDMDRDTFCSFLISDLHDFAHDVGRARLKNFRTGSHFLDNPYDWNFKATDMIMEAMQ